MNYRNIVWAKATASEKIEHLKGRVDDCANGCLSFFIMTVMIICFSVAMRHLDRRIEALESRLSAQDAQTESDF